MNKPAPPAGKGCRLLGTTQSRNVFAGLYHIPQHGWAGVDRLLIEGNRFDLTTDPGVPTAPTAILVADPETTHPYGQVIIRHNRFRYVEGVTGVNSEAAYFDGSASFVAGADAVIISDNLVETIPSGGESGAIVTTGCTAVTRFDNRTQAGTLVVPDTDRYRQQLDVPAEELLASATLDK